MDHPVKSNSFSGLIYWFIPLFLGSAQAVFNIWNGVLPVALAFTDGIVFGFLIGLLGLAIWYVVRYNNAEENNFLQLTISHVLAAVIFTACWILISEFLVKSLISDSVYEAYLRTRISGRAFEGILFYALLACFYYLYIYSQNSQLKRQREAELLGQLRNAQLNALKSQINPHFLFNGLNSIASLTINDPEKAHEMIVALSGFLRYSLQKNISEMVTLETELQNIDLYLQIEKIRFGDKLSYQYHVEESCRNNLIPNLILQPVFENAIKYGVYELAGAVEIKLHAVESPAGMRVTVTNNFDPETNFPKGDGVGLKNIRERLRIIYGSSQLLSTEKNKDVFLVSLVIPGKMEQ